MTLILSRSRAASDFKKLAGQNNHFLVTILVGLDEVRSGRAERKPEFSTTWDPKDVVQSADRSRMYATRTALLWIVEAFEGYAASIRKTAGVFSEPEQALIRGESGDGKSRRLVRLNEVLGEPDSAELALVRAAMDWRNRIAHFATTGNLDGEVKGQLRKFADEISGAYRHLEVDRLIQSISNGAAPSFKEVASIIEATHKLVRRLDEAVGPRMNSVQFAEQAIRDYVEALSVDRWKQVTQSIWQGNEQRSVSKLASILRQVGFVQVESDDVESPVDEYIKSLAQISVEEARLTFRSA
ncbi:hypothetical protein [Plantibacter sp. VKM Ac-2876]|uniref:hypothetical protein n=1 Tax=Plantibacter sp. VKM Ac-2876 TaxID=2783826 RepID=UPI00188D4714|nr:hypothetical protein [Plantibacter sp. VKM Ac-2876]MBF4563968.1 hypothetical protein [Plantibacter sp. VKM Ac-2876]